VRALRVISRTTAMQYKGTPLSLREIGTAVGVRWALTGSVRRAGTALRISAQLVDVQRDEPTWAEKYQGTLDDVFDVQERVSRAIVQALDVALSPQESAQLASRDPSLIASIEREARALIAEVPDQPYGHALLGYLAYETGDQVTAVRALRRAHALDPADGDIRFFLGISHQAGGRENSRIGHEWIALDPLSPLANILVAANSWFTGRLAEGLPYLDEAVRLAPAGLIFHWGLGNHHALMGRYDAAARQVAWLREHAPQLPYTAQLDGLVAAATGRPGEALAILATIDETVLDGHHTFHLGESYIMAGAHERGVALLDRALSMGFCTVEYLEQLCPFYEPVRGREDFARLVERARRRADEIAAALAEA
jgi:tetratricopeptide (TPR) repeat protein